MDFTAITTLDLDTSLVEVEAVLAKVKDAAGFHSNDVTISFTPDTQQIHVVAQWRD